MESNDWKPSKVVTDNAKVQDLKLIFSEAKDRVKEQSEDAQRLYQRSVVILGVCITILTAIIGYIGSNLKLTAVNINLFAIGIVLWIACCVLKKNITPQLYEGTGTQPKNIYNDDFFTDLTEERPAEWILLHNLIKDYQRRANVNFIHNTERGDRIKESINYLFYIPGITLLVWVLVVIFDAI